MRPKISVCLIIKNEEKHLDKCLSSIYKKFYEILILDTWSTDNSISIIKKYTNNIFYREWDWNFSNARNYIKSKAKWDYILILDADEYFDDLNINKIYNLIEKYKNIDVFDFIRINNWEYFRKKEQTSRLFKNKKEIYYVNKIHERLEYSFSRKSLFVNNIFFYHNSSIKWKLWNDFWYYERIFYEDPNNSTVSLYLIDIFLSKRNYKKTLNILLKINRVHYMDIKRMLKLSLILWQKEHWKYILNNTLKYYDKFTRKSI